MTKQQTYSSKSTAIRGAKRAGMKDGSFTVEQTSDGKFMVKPTAVAFVKGTNKVAGEKKAKAAKQPVPMLRESTAQSPTKLVWHIADEMKGARRKDVIAECVKRGIAFYTARTQYQLWKSLQVK